MICEERTLTQDTTEEKSGTDWSGVGGWGVEDGVVGGGGGGGGGDNVCCSRTELAMP